MNDNAAPKTQPPKQTGPDRTPIPVEKLIFISANPHGLSVPFGPEGKSDKMLAYLVAGEHSDTKTEIEHRPWMRVFRVVKSKKVTRTGKDGKEVASWEPMGKAFHVPDACAVSVPADE